MDEGVIEENQQPVIQASDITTTVVKMEEQQQNQPALNSLEQQSQKQHKRDDDQLNEPLNVTLTSSTTTIATTTTTTTVSTITTTTKMSMTTTTTMPGTMTTSTTRNRSRNRNRNRTAADNNSNILPRHMRLRYWNSYEELHLVELWRLHASEIVGIPQHSTVYRTIVDAMRKLDIQVNSQETRRKLHALKNKYFLEKERLQRLASANTNDGSTAIASDWRLYSLIACVLEPKEEVPDLQHELRVVNKVLALLPSNISQTPPMVAPPLLSSNTPANSYERVYNQRLIINHSNGDGTQRENSPVPIVKRFNFLYKLQKKSVGTTSMKLPSLPTLEELRASNHYLKMNCDLARKRLEVAEAEFEMWQKQLNQWQLQHEHFLEIIQCFATSES